MTFGLDSSNLAPQLIQNSGAALVQGIRQIGQQISGHLTEMQVRRDLGALAQEMQGMNVQSNEFPMQLAQLTARHPMAAKDDRAKMLLTPLGTAHAAWQAGEAEARAFNRAMAMQTRRRLDARDEFDYESDAKMGMPQNIGGALVVPKDPTTGQPNVLLPAPARAGAGPKTLAPGAILVDPTGKKLAENPKAIMGSPSEARLSKKTKVDALMRTDSNLQREIDSAIKRLDDIQKQDLELGKDEAKVGHPKKDFLVTTARAIQEEVAGLRKRRTDIQKAIEGIELGAAEMELGMAPELGAVAAPAAGANVRRVPVLDPNGNPMQLREDQVEAALQNGWKRR